MREEGGDFGSVQNRLVIVVNLLRLGKKKIECDKTYSESVIEN